MTKKERATTYQSVTPAANMVLKKKWDEKMYTKHRHNVENAKARIDNRLSDHHIQFNFRLRTIHRNIERRRQAEIAKLNQEMLRSLMNVKGQISHFMSTPPKLLVKSRPRSATNNKRLTKQPVQQDPIRPQTAPLTTKTHNKPKVKPPWY